MDRPLKQPRNTARLKFKRNALTILILLAVVLGIGALPVLFLYFFGQ